MADPKAFPRDVEIILSTVFKEPDGSVGEPATVTLTMVDPTGVTNVLEPPDIENTSPGGWRYVFTPTVEGWWHYRWLGLDGLQAVDEDTFYVQRV